MENQIRCRQTWQTRYNRNGKVQRRCGTADLGGTTIVVQCYRFIKNAGAPVESLTAIRSHMLPRLWPIRPRWSRAWCESSQGPSRVQHPTATLLLKPSHVMLIHRLRAGPPRVFAIRSVAHLLHVAPAHGGLAESIRFAAVGDRCREMVWKRGDTGGGRRERGIPTIIWALGCGRILSHHHRLAVGRRM